ncbi:ABC1 kinase family protein [Candidatus Electronema sp. JC]|uniref:ABC1 kinase family protein n=1 Tax=Candidatus Electronema sp. JC TaxID=3401570 RepID=UPI003B43258F
MVSIRQFGVFNRTFRHLNRYQQILRVLFRYGFSDLAEHLHLDHYGLQLFSRNKQRDKEQEQLLRHSRPERLRMALEELGPTFIKLGQLLSVRPDLVPPDYLKELAKLQDEVPPFPYEEVRQIFLEELGKEPDEIFAVFSREPVAAASISQVHHARLELRDAEGGQRRRKVVVKVQRPRLERIISIDLEILARIAQLMEDHLEEVQGHRPTAIVREFSRSLSREIDFTIELANIQHFARQFAGCRELYVPEAFPALSTQRILVMERIDGIKASDIEGLRAAGHDLTLLAERGARLVMEQIFTHGFFHADPHPGNIFFLPGNVVCFIDFGQMGRLLFKDRETFIELVASIVSGDESRVTASLLQMTVQQGEFDRDALSLDISDFMSRYLHLSIGDLEIGRIHWELLRLFSRHQMFLKPGLYLMLKSLGTAEGVGLMLDPQIEMLSLAKPFIRKIKMERVSPRRLAAEAADTGAQYLHLFRDLPAETRSVLAMLRQGKVRLELEHHGLRPLEKALYRVSNRIAYAIVLAALIIGSSLVVLSGIKPKWHDIPIIGVAGFLLAGCMGFGLLISILRQGKGKV